MPLRSRASTTWPAWGATLIARRSDASATPRRSDASAATVPASTTADASGSGTVTTGCSRVTRSSNRRTALVHSTTAMTGAIPCQRLRGSASPGYSRPRADRFESVSPTRSPGMAVSSDRRWKVRTPSEAPKATIPMYGRGGICSRRSGAAPVSEIRGPNRSSSPRAQRASMRPMRIGRAGSPAPRMVGVSTRSIVVPMSLLLIAFHARLPDQKSPDYPAHRMGMHMTPCVRRYVKQHPDICQTMNASYTTRPRCGITSVPTVLDNQPALPKTRPERHNINHTRHDYAAVCCRIRCRDSSPAKASPYP